MKAITLTECDTGRKIHINPDLISHFFESANLDTGHPATLIYLNSTTLYCVEEHSATILELLHD